MVQVYLKEIMSDETETNEKAWERECSATLFKDKVSPMWGFRGNADSQTQMLSEMTTMFVKGTMNSIAKSTLFKEGIKKMAFSVLSAEGFNNDMERE